MAVFLIKLIKFYQSNVSCGRAPRCKFFPTCSRYGIEAIERFGALKGSVLTIWRILRCNPFSSGGFDPVPEKKNRGN